MIAEQNLVTSGAYDRLVDSTYVHSNTDNFVNASMGKYLFELKSLENSIFKKEKMELIQLITKINNEVNIFYDDVGINSKDMISSAGEASFNGAAEFSRKYLITNKEGIASNTLSKNLLTIINSTKMAEVIFAAANSAMDEKNLNLETQQAIEKNWQKIHEGFAPRLRNELSTNASEISFSIIEKGIENLFTTSKTTGKTGRIIRKTRLKTSVNQDALEEEMMLDLKKFKFTRNQDLDELKRDLNAKFLTPLIAEYVANAAAKYVIDEVRKIYKTRRNENWYSNLYNYIKQVFTKGFKEYKGGIDLKESRKLSGFLLEYGLEISMSRGDLGQKYLREVKVIGQNLDKLIYKRREFDDQGQENLTNISFPVQSGSDLTITGRKSQKIYKIQAKNSFTDKEYLNIRMQSEIKLSTFLPTAFENIDYEKEFAYLVLNKAFLEKNGLDKNGKKNLLQSNEEIENYIRFFLYQTISFLIGMELDKQTNGFSEGNLFFIYKGKYLIPISMFLYSSLQFITMFENNIKKDNLKGIGGFSYNKNLGGIETSMEEASKLQQKKHEELSNIPEGTDYRYPENLVKIGSDFGKQLYNKAKINRINFTPHISKIENLLKMR